jgi:hypothetical protein
MFFNLQSLARVAHGFRRKKPAGQSYLRGKIESMKKGSHAVPNIAMALARAFFRKPGLRPGHPEGVG